MRMEHHRTEWALRPSVPVTVAYVGAVSCWFRYLLVTIRFHGPFDEQPWTLIPSTHYWAFTACNTILALWCLAGVRSAWRAPVGYRLGQLAGLGIALVTLGVLQSGAQALHHPLSVPGSKDPLEIQALVEARGPRARETLSAMLDAIGESCTEVVVVSIDEMLWIKTKEHPFLTVDPRDEHHDLILRIDPHSPWHQELRPGPWALEETVDGRIRVRVPFVEPAGRDELRAGLAELLRDSTIP